MPMLARFVAKGWGKRWLGATLLAGALPAGAAQSGNAAAVGGSLILGAEAAMLLHLLCTKRQHPWKTQRWVALFVASAALPFALLVSAFALFQPPPPWLLTLLSFCVVLLPMAVWLAFMALARRPS
jgi:hypothetical protein